MSLGRSIFFLVVALGLANCAAPDDSPAWWQAEYPQLVEALSARGSAFPFSYPTGPEGGETVSAGLGLSTEGALRLVIHLPGAAFPASDAAEVLIEYLDDDLDTRPDRFRIQPESAGPPADLPEGFVAVQSWTEYREFLIMWSVGVAFGANSLLHGNQSMYR